MSILSTLITFRAILVLLTVITASVHATVATTGDVDPSGAAMQPDP